MAQDASAQETTYHETDEIVLSVRDITVAFDDKVILDGLSLDIRRGEILGFVGASGSRPSACTRSSATSMAGSAPTTSPRNARPSAIVTVIRSAPSMTW